MHLIITCLTWLLNNGFFKGFLVVCVHVHVCLEVKVEFWQPILGPWTFSER